MNDMIMYRPYRSHALPLFFTIPAGMLAFVATGYCVPYWEYYVLIMFAIGIVCVWLTKVLYDSSNIAVYFEQEGLRIIGGSYSDYRYVLWEEFSYAYYTRSFKGHLFLVLSPSALSPKEAKHFANQGANSSRVCIDYVVVIYLDFLQDVSQIKEIIDHHVVNVDTY